MADRSVHDDTLALARQLIACQSVTPDDGGALDLIARRLTAGGFTCERLDRGGVGNLWARRGSGTPLVCLAGHVDVVPPGPLDAWTSHPFTPAERNGYLYGRGASDMKGPLAAMLTAVERVAASGAADHASLAVVLTSDEEGDAVHGTLAVVDALRARQIAIDACILGEPTSTDRLGDTVKNGRRGSLSGRLTVRGVQRHIAYPERGPNPIHIALPALAELAAVRWDEGNEYFQPSSFQISNIHAGTGAPNVTPGMLDVLFNIRFSPESTEERLKGRVAQVLARHGVDGDLVWTLSGSPFLTPRGPLVEALSAAIVETTGRTPALSTGGGTSDGRFLAAIAREIVEFGPSNESIHTIDERVRIADLAPLSAIYERTLLALVSR